MSQSKKKRYRLKKKKYSRKIKNQKGAGSHENDDETQPAKKIKIDIMQQYYEYCKNSSNKQIGQGGFGKVYLYDINVEPIVLKVINITNRLNLKGSILSEIESLQRVSNYPFLQILNSNFTIQEMEVETNIFLIPMKLIESNVLQENGKYYIDLLDILNDLMDIPREKLCNFFYNIYLQLMCSILYCHQKHIYHKDVKIDNILVNKEGYAILTDFGLSTILDEECNIQYPCHEITILDTNNSERKEKTNCGTKQYSGTIPYISPRQTNKYGVRINDSCEDEKGDFWSLIILMAIMAYPLDPTNLSELQRNIFPIFYFDRILYYHLDNVMNRYMLLSSTDAVEELMIEKLIENNGPYKPHVINDLFEYVKHTDRINQTELIQYFQEACNYSFHDYLITSENIERVRNML